MSSEADASTRKVSPSEVTEAPPGTADWPSLDLNPSASSGRVNLVEEFYLPCLALASTYDRAVGYFRSSLFALVGVGISNFAQRSGTIRLVCSPSLTAVDVTAIQNGLNLGDAIDWALKSELEAVVASPRNVPVIRLLATLVALGRLKIRIAYRAGASGIFHDKVGIFGHESNPQVSFVGSSNETYSAWDASGNHEVVEVFRSWISVEERQRVIRHAAYFESLWNGEEPGLEVRDLPDVPRHELLKWQVESDLDEVIDEVRRAWRVGDVPPGGKENPRPLMPHQEAVVRAWMKLRRGIISHATGAGKTLSAIAIVRAWLLEGGSVIIAVPGELLLDQWRSELEVELADIKPAILQVGGGASREQWLRSLADFTRAMPGLGPRVTLATMATAGTDGFRRRVQGGGHLLVVADEVHRIGSPMNVRLTSLNAGGRLGLSATPERFGDTAGTTAILDYFGPVLEPAFGLSDAIEAGRLVPYDYYVHLVQLNDDEASKWFALTDQIRRAAGRHSRDRGEDAQIPDVLKMLLIRRARIIKQAEAKVQVASDIVAEGYQPGQSWLVYCENQVQLAAVLDSIRGRDIDAIEYHSAMIGSRRDTMAYFKERTGVLVAIRCLDEGVDIPGVTHALILASSTNTREYIQRRGRVLRKAPGKYAATVHDTLVAIGSESGLRIVDSDLNRAVAFARLARNESVRQDLQAITRHLGAGDSPNFEDDEG